MTILDTPHVLPAPEPRPSDTARVATDGAARTIAPPLVIRESPLRRVLFALVMLAVVLLYARCLHLYFYPANGGVDQNGYLVGGKLLALTGSDGRVPQNLYTFVGSMWNLGPDGKTYYPKYPLGLPALYALCIKLFGLAKGCYASYFVPPLGAVMAVWGTYLLARPYVGGFGAVIASLALAVSPLMMTLANNPNSHAATVGFVTWGMVFLLSWWRSGGGWRAAMAGFLLGYALTIRYTEGLLLLPMTVVFVDRWFRRQRGAYWQGLLMACSWLVPVGVLLWFNMSHFGSPTGYDSTRESTGFGWNYFVANWDLLVRDMNDKALVLIFPLGLAGLGLMTAKPGGWRLSLILAAWIFPSLLTYAAYYWAPDGTSVAYSRFFLTVLPGLLLAATWTLTRAPLSHHAPPADKPWRGAVLGAGLIGLLATAASAAQDAEVVIPDARQNMLVDLAASYAQKAPKGSVFFTSTQIIDHLQFVSDYDCYLPETFNRNTVQRLNQTADLNDPNPLQPQRAAALYSKLKDKTDAQLVEEQQALMSATIAAGNHVYFLAPVNQIVSYQRRFAPPAKFSTRVAAQWIEPGDWRRSRWQRTANAVAPSWTGRRGQQPLAPPPGQTWQMLEVLPPKPLPAPPPPAPKPTTPARPPATRPASKDLSAEDRAKRKAQALEKRAAAALAAAASRPATRPAR